MADITISGELAERLEAIAKTTNRAVEDVVQEALTYIEDQLVQNTHNDKRSSFAELARIARDNPIDVQNSDTSIRSREILEDEFTDYLLKRRKIDKTDE